MEIERICKNCKLYNKAEGVCSVVIVNEGEKYELPVDPYDECHWERVDREIQNELKNAINTAPDVFFKQQLIGQTDTPVEIKQIRMWSNGRDGFIEAPAEIMGDGIWGDTSHLRK